MDREWTRSEQGMGSVNKSVNGQQPMERGNEQQVRVQTWKESNGQ